MVLSFLQPATIAEACFLLAKHGQQAKILAGGTDLLVDMRNGHIKPQVLIDLTSVQELGEIAESEGAISIGSTVTFADLALSKLIQTKLPVLAQAAKVVGSPQIRNRGTIGGNIANASPAADVVPVLVALEGVAVVAKAGGVKEVPLEELITGPYRTALACDELISGVKVKVPQPGTGMSFAKVGRRNSLAISRLNGVCLLKSEGQIIRQVRLVLGSATPTPARFKKVEEYLVGENASAEVFREAGKIAAEYVQQVTGRRASSAYKLPVVENLTTRLLQEAWEKGGSVNE